MPPDASTTAWAGNSTAVSAWPSLGRATTPRIDRPSRVRLSPTQPSRMRIDGVALARAISAAMISRPALSPLTWTMRRSECAASRPTASSPAASRSNGTP